MKCVVCGYGMGNAPPPCARCGQNPSGAPVRSAKLDDEMENLQLQDAQRDLDDRLRRKRRLRSHALTGAITYFVLLSILSRLDPVSIVWNLVWSLVIGLPVGYSISYFGGGRFKGGMIAMAAFFFVIVLAGLPAVFRGGSLGDLFFAALVRCPIGSIPGIIIGFHVDYDD